MGIEMTKRTRRDESTMGGYIVLIATSNETFYDRVWFINVCDS